MVFYLFQMLLLEQVFGFWFELRQGALFFPFCPGQHSHHGDAAPCTAATNRPITTRTANEPRRCAIPPTSSRPHPVVSVIPTCYFRNGGGVLFSDASGLIGPQTRTAGQ